MYQMYHCITYDHILSVVVFHPRQDITEQEQEVNLMLCKIQERERIEYDHLITPVNRIWTLDSLQSLPVQCQLFP